jgi:hypothetical protein
MMVPFFYSLVEQDKRKENVKESMKKKQTFDFLKDPTENNKELYSLPAV